MGINCYYSLPLEFGCCSNECYVLYHFAKNDGWNGNVFCFNNDWENCFKFCFTCAGYNFLYGELVLGISIVMDVCFQFASQRFQCTTLMLLWMVMNYKMLLSAKGSKYLTVE